MSFEFAYALDKGEDKRGVTIDFKIRSFLLHQRNLTLIDSPGHREFVPAVLHAVLLSDFVIYVFNVKLNLAFGQIHLLRKLKKYQYLDEMWTPGVFFFWQSLTLKDEEKTRIFSIVSTQEI